MWACKLRRLTRRLSCYKILALSLSYLKGEIEGFAMREPRRTILNFGRATFQNPRMPRNPFYVLNDRLRVYFYYIVMGVSGCSAVFRPFGCLFSHHDFFLKFSECCARLLSDDPWIRSVQDYKLNGLGESRCRPKDVFAWQFLLLDSGNLDCQIRCVWRVSREARLGKNRLVGGSTF